MADQVTTARSEVPSSLKPGVVTGADYRTLVAACKSGGYALPAVNVAGTNSLNAVLEAAAKNRADVIVQLSHGGAQFYGGKSLKDAMEARILGAISAAYHTHILAEAYGVCVVLHTDHADRSLIPWLDALILESARYAERHGQPLFSSHMLDLSAEPIAQNLVECRKLLQRMAPLGISLEMELGITGGEEDGMGHEHDDRADNAHLYTQPEDVLRAYEALHPIGHFSVAASFGNVHGVYAPGNVQLRPEILQAAQALVEAQHYTPPNPLNLVFHGGSGSEKSQIAEAIRYGVFKMNIDTDTQFAFAEAVGAYIFEHRTAFAHQIDPDSGKPLKKLYDPRVWLRKGEEGMVARLNQAFADLKAVGRSLAGA